MRDLYSPSFTKVFTLYAKHRLSLYMTLFAFLRRLFLCTVQLRLLLTIIPRSFTSEAGGGGNLWSESFKTSSWPRSIRVEHLSFANSILFTLTHSSIESISSRTSSLVLPIVSIFRSSAKRKSTLNRSTSGRSLMKMPKRSGPSKDLVTSSTVELLLSALHYASYDPDSRTEFHEDCFQLRVD